MTLAEQFDEVVKSDFMEDTQSFLKHYCISDSGPVLIKRWFCHQKTFIDGSIWGFSVQLNHIRNKNSYTTIYMNNQFDS